MYYFLCYLEQTNRSSFLKNAAGNTKEFTDNHTFNFIHMI